MGSNHSHDHNQQCQHQQKTQVCNKSVISQNNTHLVEQEFPQFGGKIIVDKQRKLIIKQIQVFQFEQKQVIRILQKRKQLCHPNLNSVKSYSLRSFTNNYNILYICQPSSKILCLQFSPVLFSIQNLIKSYCQKRTPLEQKQIRRIIKSVVDCLIYLKNNDTYHGDIKPQTIFIHPKTKDVTLLDSVLINKGKTAYQIILQNPKSQSFLTPQQLEKNKYRNPESLQHIHKAQVFCVGLTLIQMMTFQSSMEAYDLDEMQIKQDFADKKRHQMLQYEYSLELCQLALKCISIQKSIRPSLQQIHKIL